MYIKNICKVTLVLAVISFVLISVNFAIAGSDKGGSKQNESMATKDFKPDPKEMQKMSMSMAPAFGAMAQNMMDGIYTGLAKPETAKKLARFMKYYYDALIAEGFSKDDAMHILRAFAIPSMSGK